MTFEEIQKLILFAKGARVKSISFDGLTFELFERGRRKKRLPKVPPQPDQKIPQAPKLPTLDDINKYIYENPEDLNQA